ncbi:MAG: hypothetical protein AB7O45_08185 [Alphaproteobacteria bacterium]
MSERPTQCSVCASPNVASINIMLANRVSLATIAARFGIGKHALYRHRKNHLDAASQMALQLGKPAAIDLHRMAEEVDSNLLGHALASLSRQHSYADKLRDIGDFAGAARTEVGIVRVLELIAKLRGLLQTAHVETRINVLISEDWGNIRGALIRALRPHPAALADVSRALRDLETQAAEDMAAGRLPVTINGKAQHVAGA